MEQLLIKMNIERLTAEVLDLIVEREVGKIHMNWIDKRINKLNNTIDSLKGRQYEVYKNKEN